MTEQEYKTLQSQFDNKLRSHHTGWETNKDEIYNEAILACKSILHQYYRSHNEDSAIMEEYYSRIFKKK